MRKLEIEGSAIVVIFLLLILFGCDPNQSNNELFKSVGGADPVDPGPAYNFRLDSIYDGGLKSYRFSNGKFLIKGHWSILRDSIFFTPAELLEDRCFLSFPVFGSNFKEGNTYVMYTPEDPHRNCSRSPSYFRTYFVRIHRVISYDDDRVFVFTLFSVPACINEKLSFTEDQLAGVYNDFLKGFLADQGAFSHVDVVISLRNGVYAASKN